ncbi:MAG: DUF962 domain-containing protein [Chitinophagales bacterium]|jgi:hypothetical protein|nr:DUF962 domain-containing protein [Sphingobacteriales bacterium]MBP7535228.1 DUF962 domain-containing protein [Chitinophagales bacterium]MBP9142822.1 DUF962 domain-containing protein [Chitinophagales bacterium]
MKKYTTFHDFYPYYLTEHQNRISRTLHFIGTGIVIALFVVFLLTFNWQYFALMPVAGYGFAWAGHAFFERNKPATFTYPLYSLGSDFVMFWHILTGQLPKKMQEARQLLNK